MSDRIHAGNMEDCAVCSPDRKKKRRERKEKKERVVTNDIALRRQIAEEFGEQEPTQSQKFAMLQKYGVAAPRIDRLVTKPMWMEDSVWQGKKTQWFQMTKGLVPAQQLKRYFGPKSSNSSRTSRPQGTRTFRPNSGPTPTATRQNSPRG